MKKNYLNWVCGLALGLAAQTTVFAQTDQGTMLRFRSGAIKPTNNARQAENQHRDFSKTLFKGNYHVIMQFETLPSDAQKAELAKLGIQLLSYMPDNAYMAVVPSNTNLNSLAKYKLRSFFVMQAPHKADAQILVGEVPQHAEKVSGYADIVITLFGNYNQEDYTPMLKGLGANLLAENKTFGTATIRVPKKKLQDLANLPFVQWVEPIDPPMVAENVPGKGNHRSSILDFGTRNLQGNGIRMGIWDGGQVGPHLDFGNRLTVVENVASDDHATHVAGTMAGGGVLDPTARGMAPRATIYSYDFQGDIPTEMQSAITTHNITLTQNSYGFAGTSVNCATRDLYSSTSRNRDLLINNNTSLLHVFSAGNAQTVSTCANGWGSTTGKADKNNLVCAAVDATDAMNTFSSFGPTQDGRLKPEIAGVGVNVYSTQPNNGYAGGATWSGTSMATPGVSGTVAQLYERYAQLNGNALPLSSLMKAVVCNTADDVNNVGPDYRTGFGRINGLRAVKVLEGNLFQINTVANGGSNDFNISVPAGTSQLKVMLAWNDPAGLANANPALVNNLNLQVIDPATSTVLPWTLDPANPGNLAVRAVNNRDNMEQVTIDLPAGGNYILRVAGTSVPTGPQQYALTWEINQPFLELTFPTGGEVLTPGSTATIFWNGAGINANQTLEYSIDNGANWVTISTTVANTARRFDWTVPSVATGQALVRVSQAALNATSPANFSIIGTPTGFTALPTCGTTGAVLSWNAVANANAYDVFLLNTTTGVWSTLASNIATTTYEHTGLTIGTDYWYAVRARNNTNSAIGQRGTASRVTAVAGLAPSPAPTAPSVTICTGNSTTLNASGGASFRWYDAANGGNLLSSNATYTTPVLSSTTTYYVETNANLGGNVGPATREAVQAIGGTFSASSFAEGIRFTVTNQATLNTVVVYPGAAGNVVLELRDGLGVVITSTSMAVTAGQVNTPVVMTLNWNLPIGSYQLGRGAASVSMHRNQTGTASAGYPYVLPNVLSINGCINVGVNEGNYYYAYNWNISSVARCPSSPRTPVTVTIGSSPVANIAYAASNYCGTATPTPTITGATGGTFSSTAGLTINATTGQITAATSTTGNYTVTYSIAANGGCGAATATTTVTIGPPTASIAYGSASYCQNAANPTPIITGRTGGVFSSTTGLNFVSTSTGAINLATSTAGTYTVTYTIPAANGCSAVTATTSVTINPLPSVPSFIVTNNTFAVSLTAASPTFVRPNEGVPPTATATGNKYYQAFTIVPTVSGSYQIDHTNTADAFLVLYSSPFTPATPLVNAIAANDDAVGLNSRIVTNLTAGQTYIIVATTFASTTTGTGTVIVTSTPPTARCQGAGTTSFVATASGATLTYSISPVGAGTIDAAGLVTWNAAFSGTATITATATGVGNCAGATQIANRNITIEATPNLLAMSVAPTINNNANSFNLHYVATAGSPNQYSITSTMPGFTPVTNATLTTNPIVVNIPTGIAGGTYNFTLTLRNTITSCVSSSIPFTLNVACSPITSVNFVQSTLNGYAAIDASWSGAVNVTTGSPKYQVRYKRSAGTEWIYWNTDATNYTMAGLEPATNYDFQVAVFCQGNVGGAWSNIYTQMTGAAPNSCPTVTLGASTPFSAPGNIVGANLTWAGGAPSPGRRFFLGYAKNGETYRVWRWIDTNGVTVRSDLDFPNLMPSSNYTYDLLVFCNLYYFSGSAVGSPGTFMTGAVSMADKVEDTSVSTQSNVISDLVIYPNPSEGDIHISYPTLKNNTVALTVIDVLGREVYSQNFTGSVSVKLDGKALSGGVYVAKIIENGRVMTKKFVIK